MRKKPSQNWLPKNISVEEVSKEAEKQQQQQKWEMTKT